MTPLQRAQSLLDHATRTAELTRAEQTAEKILIHSEAMATVAELKAYAEGVTQEYARLTTLGYVLAQTTYEATNGQNWWATELPDGKAPAFKRALVDFVTYVKRSARTSRLPP